MVTFQREAITLKSRDEKFKFEMFTDDISSQVTSLLDSCYVFLSSGQRSVWEHFNNALAVQTPGWWPQGIVREPLGIAQPGMLWLSPHLPTFTLESVLTLWRTWDKAQSFRDPLIYLLLFFFSLIYLLMKLRVSKYLLAICRSVSIAVKR